MDYNTRWQAMENMPIVPINSKEELQKVLVIQKAVSDRARIELATHPEVPDFAPEAFTGFAAKLLEKYARYSTLTEYQIVPALADSVKWGATFGVTALVGALILDHARRLLGVRNDLRMLYLKFLDALAEPGSAKIEMDALTRVFAVLSDTYGIVWADGDALSLTVVGKRVYLHLMDAAKFVEEASAAAQKFKES
jgi:hypothetical protein